MQKTLPHICKPELETMCDPYNEGIFACLERNVAKLKGKCLDTFVPRDPSLFPLGYGKMLK